MPTSKKSFRPGKDRVLYAQAVYGQEEIDAVVEALKRNWLGPGELTEKFEGEIAKLFGKKHGLFVNSGSSANLIAIEIANLPPGCEVITQACTFPTTLSPIVIFGLKPVFVDSELGSYNINPDKIEAAISPKTKAVFVAHSIGNVCDMEKIATICHRYNLIFIEDSCDIHGGKFEGKPTGFFSDITTTSFYAPHAMTAAGGGGMVMTNDREQIRQAKIFRDWGRALPENEDENIEERFSFKVGDVDYDGKFTYLKLGYNFKPIEIQAAFGLVQLKKLPKFNQRRAANFERLYNFFKNWQDHFILPEVHPKAEVYWLAFPLTVRQDSQIIRRHLLEYLEGNKIQTRLIHSGNILYHKAYQRINHRIAENLKNADMILKNSFVIGCHHGMNDDQINYVCQTFEKYLKRFLPAVKNKKHHLIYQAV